MLLLFAADAVFAHPGAQGAGVETPQKRGAVFPLDPPAGFLQHLEVVVPFQVGQGLDVLRVFDADRASEQHPDPWSRRVPFWWLLEDGPAAGNYRSSCFSTDVAFYLAFLISCKNIV